MGCKRGLEGLWGTLGGRGIAGKAALRGAGEALKGARGGPQGAPLPRLEGPSGGLGGRGGVQGRPQGDRRGAGETPNRKASLGKSASYASRFAPTSAHIMFKKHSIHALHLGRNNFRCSSGARVVIRVMQPPDRFLDPLL